MNLLSNAVKFTEKGEVTLQIGESPEVSPFSAKYAEKGATSATFFMFAVIDTGVGIPPEDQASIFEPFQQSEEGVTKGGTGLGLTIAKEQVELMGGELVCSSEVGVGSRFFFTLPFSPAKSAIPLPSTSGEGKVAHLAEGYQVRALVADDVQENRDVLSKLLSDIGVEVETCENGQQAVSMVRSHRPDIVFMDIRMPVMDGLEATKQIFSEFSREALKIVAISASALTHQQDKYSEIGFDAFIAKPLLAERIYDCLASLLLVKYEYEGDESAEHSLELDAANINIPEQLLSHLLESAEHYNITELQQCLNELDQLSEIGHRLAEHLHHLLQNGDIEGILTFLSETKTDER